MVSFSIKILLEQGIFFPQMKVSRAKHLKGGRKDSPRCILWVKFEVYPKLILFCWLTLHGRLCGHYQQMTVTWRNISLKHSASHQSHSLSHLSVLGKDYDLLFEWGYMTYYALFIHLLSGNATQGSGLSIYIDYFFFYTISLVKMLWFGKLHFATLPWEECWSSK